MTSASIPGHDPPLLGVRVTDLVSGPMQAVSRHFLDLGAQVTRVHRGRHRTGRHRTGRHRTGRHRTGWGRAAQQG